MKATELEVTPNTPPDWRDWINEFPSIKAIALFCVAAWIATGVLILGSFVLNRELAEGVQEMMDLWVDGLNWLTAAAVFGVVGKRATEKPEVVRAEGEVKAAAILAEAQAKEIQSAPQGAP